LQPGWAVNPRLVPIREGGPIIGFAPRHEALRRVLLRVAIEREGLVVGAIPDIARIQVVERLEAKDELAWSRRLC